MVEIGSVVLEMKILKFINVILLFCSYLPLEKGVALHLKKKILGSPSPNDALCQVWLKFGLWFYRKIFKFINVILLFRCFLPLEKGRALYLNKLESPSPRHALCKVLLELAQWSWRRRRKCEKFTMTMTTMTTDNEQIVIRKAHLSSGSP